MWIDLYGQLYDFFTDTYMLKSVISIYVIMYVTYSLIMKVTDLIITEWDRQTAGTLLFTLSFSSILERIQ